MFRYRQLNPKLACACSTLSADSICAMMSVEPEARVRLPDELHEYLDGFAEGLELEDLTAYVRVQPDQIEMRSGHGLPDCLEGDAVTETEAELRIDVARLDVRVCVGFDARRDPQQDALRTGAARHQLLKELELLEAIHHHEADPARQRVL